MTTPGSGVQVAVRLIRPDDADAIAAGAAANRPLTRAWEPEWRDEFYTPAGQSLMIESLLEKHRQGACWPGVIEVGSEVVGQVSFFIDADTAPATAEVGYWVVHTRWGSGVATEVVFQSLAVAPDVLDVQRVVAYPVTANVGSNRVLEKVGFTRVGVLTAHVQLQEGSADANVWQLELGV